MKNDLQKHTLNLFPGDYAKLQQFFPDVGAATIIRRVVHRFIEQIEEQGTEIETDIQVEI